MNKNNELRISFDFKGAGYDIKVFKGNEDMKINAILGSAAKDSGQLIQNDKGELSLIIMNDFDTIYFMEEIRVISESTLDLIIAESVRFATKLNRPLVAKGEESMFTNLLIKHGFLREDISKNTYIFGEGYFYNIDNIHSSKYSLLDKSKFSEKDKFRIEENLIKGGEKQERETKGRLIHKIMTDYGKILVGINQELISNNEEVRFFFVFRGCKIGNPFLDIHKEREVDPITYYGRDYLDSVFCKTCRISEAL